MTPQQIDDGGYTIQTTLQPALQQSADQAVLANAPMGDALAGVMDVVQPGTGHVLAMSVNRRYGCDAPECESVNLNVAASKGAGSTYKVFTAAAALSEGFGSRYTLNVPQPYRSKVFTGTDRNGNFGPLVVYNDNPGYASTYNMTSGLVASSNTYFVGLEDAIGSIGPVVDTAVAMGMHFDNPVTQHTAEWWKENENGTFTLGPEGTSPLDLANSYATIAASGTRCEPTPVTAILDREGKPATNDEGQPFDTADKCTPNAIAPGVANTLANMMIGVVDGGTGTRARIPGHDVAGKTGTTQENETAAFAGMTPRLAASVMLFDPKGNVLVGGHGGGTPAQIFHDALAPILAGQPNTPFPPPDPAVAAGTRGSGYTPPAPRPPANEGDQGNEGDGGTGDGDNPGGGEGEPGGDGGEGGGDAPGGGGPGGGGGEPGGGGGDD
jgi:membrane peptidoglycan carboxypeptidase